MPSAMQKCSYKEKQTHIPVYFDADLIWEVAACCPLPATEHFVLKALNVHLCEQQTAPKLQKRIHLGEDAHQQLTFSRSTLVC